MKQKILISLALISLVCTAWCSLIPENNTPEETVNPASEYCEQNWWTLEIVPDEWWSRWKCNFDDGSFCEERAYYHGECSPDRWNGNTIEMEEIQNNEEISEEDKQEVSEVIEEIETISENELQENLIVCTADVKQCDDGTYVSRGWPNCEFWPCPWIAVDENTIQDTLDKYKSSWSEMTESDIDLMNEIIDAIAN